MTTHKKYEVPENVSGLEGTRMFLVTSNLSGLEMLSQECRNAVNIALEI
jgi:hypothetical protein